MIASDTIASARGPRLSTPRICPLEALLKASAGPSASVFATVCLNVAL